jgi:hypothetical protein
MWSYGQPQAELQAPGQQEVGRTEAEDAGAVEEADDQDASRRPQGQPRQPLTSARCASALHYGPGITAMPGPLNFSAIIIIMKKRYLYKLTPNVQVGHLYEHLYCHQLAQTFRQKGLFAYVDYSINGKTFYDGYVEIEVTFHNKHSLRYEALVDQLHILVNEDTISGGLLQIMAEKRVEVWDRDDEIIEMILSRLDAEKWQSSGNQVKEAAQASRQTEEGLEFIEKTQRNFLNITQVISLNTHAIAMNSHDASTLFAVVSAALRENLQDFFARSLFSYSVRDSFTKKGSLLIDRNTYRVDKRQKRTLTDEDERMLAAWMLEMKSGGFVERVAQCIKDAPLDAAYKTPQWIETLLRTSTVTCTLGKSTIKLQPWL